MSKQDRNQKEGLITNPIRCLRLSMTGRKHKNLHVQEKKEKLMMWRDPSPGDGRASISAGDSIFELSWVPRSHTHGFSQTEQL